MQESDEPDFDFDAHIAKLMACSQRDLDYVPARNWPPDNSSTSVSKAKGRHHHATTEGDNDYDYDLDDNDLEDDNMSTCTGTTSRAGAGGRPGPMAPLTAAQREVLETQFEKTLEEYGEDEVGDLEDDDEEERRGFIDYDGDNELLESALDEYLEDRKHELMYEMPDQKISRKDNGGNNSLKVVAIAGEDEEVLDGDEVLRSSVLVKEAVREQEEQQVEAAVDLLEIESLTVNERPEDVFHCQAYLREEKILEEWDCESVLSTYSTLDNHPSVIKDSKGFRPHRSRFVIATEHADEKRRQMLLSTETKLSNHHLDATFDVNETAKRIELGGKLMLPKGYGPGKARVEDGSSDSEGEDGSVAVTVDTSIGRPRNETPEEKKLRKSQAKLVKNEKKSMKKSLKIAYKDEFSKNAKINSRQQDIDHAHVFHYTNN